MLTDFANFWSDHLWGRLGLTIAGALGVAFIVRSTAYVAVRRLARGHPVIASMLSRANAPMEWLMPLLTVAVALRAVPDLESLHGLESFNHFWLS